jgi:hypothetical protein
MPSSLQNTATESASWSRRGDGDFRAPLTIGRRLDARDAAARRACDACGCGQTLPAGARAIGAHKAAYPLTSGLNGCGPGEAKLPPPDLDKIIEREGQVFSGTILRGHICFEIASNDARSLSIYVNPLDTGNGPQSQRIWFALR